LAFNTWCGPWPGILELPVSDEPFESLDEGSTERVIELCGMLDLPNIFVITHQQAIKDMIPSRILVEKTRESEKSSKSY
jgi:DNA repair exonuclease SbcCD ATPase subunit